jgi:hypothetical protein
MKNAPNGNRIHVDGLKGRCPRPLDDGGAPDKYTREKPRQTISANGAAQKVNRAVITLICSISKNYYLPGTIDIIVEHIVRLIYNKFIDKLS